MEKRSASDLEKTLKFSSEKIIQIDTQIRGILSMKKVEIQRDVYAINELSLAQCLSFLLCLFFNRKTLWAVFRKKGSFVSWFKLFIKKHSTIFGFLFQKIVLISNTNSTILMNSWFRTFTAIHLYICQKIWKKYFEKLTKYFSSYKKKTTLEFSFRFKKNTNTRRSYQLEGIMDICSYIIQRNKGI